VGPIYPMFNFKKVVGVIHELYRSCKRVISLTRYDLLSPQDTTFDTLRMWQGGPIVSFKVFFFFFLSLSLKKKSKSKSYHVGKGDKKLCLGVAMYHILSHYLIATSVC